MINADQELVEKLIFDFLKQNLKIQVSERFGTLTVKLDLCDVLIASDTCDLPEPKISYGNRY